MAGPAPGGEGGSGRAGKRARSPKRGVVAPNSARGGLATRLGLGRKSALLLPTFGSAVPDAPIFRTDSGRIPTRSSGLQAHFPTPLEAPPSSVGTARRERANSARTRARVPKPPSTQALAEMVAQGEGCARRASRTNTRTNSPPDGPKEKSWETTRTLARDMLAVGCWVQFPVARRRTRPVLVKASPIFAQTGPLLLRFSQDGPGFGQHLSSFGRLGPNFATGARKLLPKCSRRHVPGVFPASLPRFVRRRVIGRRHCSGVFSPRPHAHRNVLFGICRTNCKGSRLRGLQRFSATRRCHAGRGASGAAWTRAGPQPASAEGMCEPIARLRATCFCLDRYWRPI